VIGGAERQRGSCRALSALQAAFREKRGRRGEAVPTPRNRAYPGGLCL
jgi:hypothetical protein